MADASHELKTPLTVILSNMGIVLSRREDTVDRQSIWLEYIWEEAMQMKGLVDDLLFLAKSDDARRSACPSEVCLSELVLGCLLPFEPVAFESGVTLDSGICPALTPGATRDSSGGWSRSYWTTPSNMPVPGAESPSPWPASRTRCA